jgi:DNA helicase-2/ATP-dependent DNA helicase PcrA
MCDSILMRIISGSRIKDKPQIRFSVDVLKRSFHTTAMSFIADLHIHSRFARACSPAITIPSLSEWAKYKGLDVLGTGDCLHPGWRREFSDVLQEVESGTYDYRGTRFVLQTEVALTFSDQGRTRRPHVLLLFPSMETLELIAAQLCRLGADLEVDGRPVLHLTVRQLIELCLSIDSKMVIIPAHIWTPWYSLMGSRTGYNSLVEAVGDYLPHIHAIETGLSSDPAMNWPVEDFQERPLVSFSDAHSLPKLGREATRFAGGPTFQAIREALQTRAIECTYEYFPAEGKYYWSGHRKCGVRRSPEEIRSLGTACPTCKKPLTLGVAERIKAMSYQTCVAQKRLDSGLISSQDERFAPFYRLLPLMEILAQLREKGVNTKTVHSEYMNLLRQLGSEISILTTIPITDIESKAQSGLAEALHHLRLGQVDISPGFDNQYGHVFLNSSQRSLT